MTTFALAATIALAPARPAPLPQTRLIPVNFDQDAAKPQDGDQVAIMQTSVGRIVLMFFPQVAPKHVQNFIALAESGFYNGTRFHRCIPTFMVQGGDPLSTDLTRAALWGSGGPVDERNLRKTTPAEFSQLKHRRGILSMARASDPDSAGSQFFIMHGDSPHLDGQYSAFGKVIEGIETVDKIVATGPTDRSANGKVPPDIAVVLESVTIARWPIQ